MSKIPERAMFLHPSLYSSDKFRVKHVIAKPTAQPGVRKYFTHGDLMVFNLGAAPNEFVIPETAYLCFSTKVTANTIIGSEDQSPWPTAKGGYNQRTPYGLPRIDYGLPFFDQINVDLDSSRNIVNLSGAALCRSVLNGRIACSSMTTSPDVLDTIKGRGLLPIDCHNSTGPASLCGFISNTQRVKAYSGLYRNNVRDDANNYLSRFGNTNGSNNYKIPLSCVTGLLDACASSWLPLGMLSQSSASGLSLKFRIAKKEDVLVDSKIASSIIPEEGFTFTYLVKKENDYSEIDGTKRTVAYIHSTNTANDQNVFMYPPTANGAPGVAAEFENFAGATAWCNALLSYVQERKISDFKPDGRGADLSGSFCAIFEPVIVYRVVEILDETLLNLLRASFNGQNVETIEMAGQMVNIPKLLNIKYRGFNFTQQLYPAKASNMVWNITNTEPSFRGIMIRFSVQTDEGVTKDESKSPDPPVVVTKFQVKIGSAVYPLTPIEQSNNGSIPSVIAPANAGDIPAIQSDFLSSADTVAYAHMAGLQEDARALFSPWFDTESSDNIEDVTFAHPFTVGNQSYKDMSGLQNKIRPLLLTFDNHTNYEKEKLDNGATGVDMRGIGSYTVELSLRETGANALALPAQNYNVFIGDCYDAVLSVKRNAVDPAYQFAVF